MVAWISGYILVKKLLRITSYANWPDTRECQHSCYIVLMFVPAHSVTMDALEN